MWNTKETEKSIIKKQHYKISKLLNDSTVSKFVTKKRVRVNDLCSSQHSANKNVRFKASMLRSDLADYSDVYIFYKRGNISFSYIFRPKIQLPAKTKKSEEHHWLLHIQFSHVKNFILDW